MNSEQKERKGTMRNIKNIIAIGGVSAAMGVAALTGCANLKNRLNDTPKDERSEGRVADDNRITKSVQERLKAEPVYKFDSVDVNTFAGIVQLSGFVNTPDQKSRAQDIAQRTEGVAQVVNALVLKPAATLSPTGQSSGQHLS